jgi:heme A synthase
VAALALVALQGLVGLDQYETHLPTELVWVHVSLAALTWVAVLWTACAAGRLQPRRLPGRDEVREDQRQRRKYVLSTR